MTKPLYRIDLLIAAARRGWARPAVGSIARAAGVSEATARHVLLDRTDLVASETVKRVMAALGLREAERSTPARGRAPRGRGVGA